MERIYKNGFYYIKPFAEAKKISEAYDWSEADNNDTIYGVHQSEWPGNKVTRIRNTMVEYGDREAGDFTDVYKVYEKIIPMATMEFVGNYNWDVDAYIFPEYEVALENQRKLNEKNNVLHTDSVSGCRKEVWDTFKGDIIFVYPFEDYVLYYGHVFSKEVLTKLVEVG